MSWKLEPHEWLAPPDSATGMPLAQDPLDRQAMAAMSEPIGMLDEHALDVGWPSLNPQCESVLV